MKKFARWVALPIVGVIGLSGCAHQGSTAAIVNGVEIPDSVIVDYAKACAPVLTQRNEPNMIRFDMVQWVVLGEISDQYVAEHPDQRPSEDDVEAYAEQHPVLSHALREEGCRAVALDVAQYQVVALNLGGRAGDYIQGNEVLLNPRYGAWDPEKQAPNQLASLAGVAED